MEVADVEVYLKFTEVEERKNAPKFLGIKTVIITPVHRIFGGIILFLIYIFNGNVFGFVLAIVDYET